MKTGEEKTARLVSMLWRMADGEVETFLPMADRVPPEVEAFLKRRPSLPERRAALLAICRSLMDET